MPKDPTENIDRYKIRGGQLNEFEYTENQKALAGKKAKGGGKLIPGTPPEAKASKATKGTQSTKGKATKKANKSSEKAKTAKKSGAQKTAKKK